MTPARSVIKIGGSILRDETAYEGVAQLVTDQIARGPTWFVVSAANGITDDLERLACATDVRDPRGLLARQARASGVPPDHALDVELRRGVREARLGRMDRLLAWGEQASAEALRVHLSRRGVAIPVVELTSEIAAASVPAALVPGFYIRDRQGRFSVLPRGGSDISAVMAAIRLGTPAVRFWKEGGGIHAEGRILREIDASTVLSRLSGTVRPLHPDAVTLASAWGIDLILEDPSGKHGPTRIVSPSRSRAGLGFGLPSAGPPAHLPACQASRAERTQ